MENGEKLTTQVVRSGETERPRATRAINIIDESSALLKLTFVAMLDHRIHPALLSLRHFSPE